MAKYITTTDCVGRKTDGLLFFVGDCSHPAFAAVERCNECHLAGKVPPVEDMMLLDTLPLLDEVDAANSQLLIV